MFFDYFYNHLKSKKNFFERNFENQKRNKQIIIIIYFKNQQIIQFIWIQKEETKKKISHKRWDKNEKQKNKKCINCNSLEFVTRIGSFQHSLSGLKVEKSFSLIELIGIQVMRFVFQDFQLFDFVWNPLIFGVGFESLKKNLEIFGENYLIHVYDFPLAHLNSPE